MIHGVDTGFLVAAELLEHAEHADARATLSRLLGAGDQIAIAPQVLAEFIHIVTDSRRSTYAPPSRAGKKGTAPGVFTSSPRTP